MTKKKPIQAKPVNAPATSKYDDVVSNISLILSNYICDVDKCTRIAKSMVDKMADVNFSELVATNTPEVAAKRIICANLRYISTRILDDTPQEVTKAPPNAVETARRMMFEAYAKFDFVDLTNMLNYRHTQIVPSVRDANERDNIEETYIHSGPGAYTVMELQAYVYAILQDVLSRFAAQVNEYPNDDGIFADYYNMTAGIFCLIDKKNCEISYQPVRSVTLS